MGRPNDGPDSAQLRSRLQQVEKELGALRQLMQAMEKRLGQEIKRREDAQRQYDAERKAEARNSELTMRVGRLSHLLQTTLESRPPTLDDLYAAAPQVELTAHRRGISEIADAAQRGDPDAPANRALEAATSMPTL